MLQPLDILKLTQMCIKVRHNTQVTGHKQDGCQKGEGPSTSIGGDVKPSFLNGNAPQGERERERRN